MKVVGLLGVLPVLLRRLLLGELLVPLRRLLLGVLLEPLRRLLMGVLPVLLQLVLLQLLLERNLGPGLLVSPTMRADTPRPGPYVVGSHYLCACFLLLFLSCASYYYVFG
jgi:hypothetical protein